MEDRVADIARKTSDPQAATRALRGLLEESESFRRAVGHLETSFLENLAELFVVSPAIRDLVRRHPEWIAWLQEEIRSGAPDVDDSAAELAWSSADSTQSRLEQVRLFKSRCLVTIAYQDVCGMRSLTETVRNLSKLARIVIRRTLEVCWENLAGQTTGLLGDRVPQGFSILALGKLGGDELNYSSDVDLMFVREDQGTGAEERLLTRLGERMIQALSQSGSESFLYRVDMRLRPYGETGPLVPSFAGVTTYYESWSEAWERQALLKARFIAGDEELGRRLEEFIERFAFSRPMDDLMLEEIKRVKHRSEREYALSPGRVHLKQGEGGIRDIEFYVQYLQLIAGVGNPLVRKRSTLEGLQALAATKSLLAGEESGLSLAYTFLRILEHRLQLRNLTPNSILPEQGQELTGLARALGYREPDALESFLRALQIHRKVVRRALERIYLSPGYLHLREREEELAALLTDRAPRNRIAVILTHYGFENVEKAWQNLRLLALGPAGRLLPPGERRQFLSFAYTLLEVMARTLDPDSALHHLESFAAATGNRVSFLRALSSARPQLHRLANLLAFSGPAHQVLTRHPEFFDSLARGYHILEGRTAPEMRAEVEGRFAQAPPQVPRGAILRVFRQREAIRIAYRDMAGVASARSVGEELTELAEACVLAAAALALETPSQTGATDLPELQILAVGKFGSRCLHYSSDLDLVFLYQDPEVRADGSGDGDIQKRMDRLAENFVRLLSEITEEGRVYSVDLRLRPEGSAGLLARSLSAFEEYARCAMQPWERMALVRSRRIGGFAGGEWTGWEPMRKRVVYEFPWNQEALGALRHLKRRIDAEKSHEGGKTLDFKYGRGGVVDLEYLVQFLQLLHGSDNPEVRVPETRKALSALLTTGALDPEEGSVLVEALEFQRLVENRHQLMQEWAGREVSRESPQLALLARSMGFADGTETDARRGFIEKWERLARAVRELLERHLFQE